MSRKPWAIHRQDATRKARLEEAKALGWLHIKVDGIFDDILWHPGRVAIYFVDWKGKRTPTTNEQHQLIAAGFPLHLIETQEELLTLLSFGGMR